MRDVYWLLRCSTLVNQSSNSLSLLIVYMKVIEVNDPVVYCTQLNVFHCVSAAMFCSFNTHQMELLPIMRFVFKLKQMQWVYNTNQLFINNIISFLSGTLLLTGYFMDETCGSLRGNMRTQYRLKRYLFWRHSIFGTPSLYETRVNKKGNHFISKY